MSAGLILLQPGPGLTRAKYQLLLSVIVALGPSGDFVVRGEVVPLLAIVGILLGSGILSVVFLTGKKIPDPLYFDRGAAHTWWM